MGFDGVCLRFLQIGEQAAKCREDAKAGRALRTRKTAVYHFVYHAARVYATGGPELVLSSNSGEELRAGMLAEPTVSYANRQTQNHDGWQRHHDALL